MDFVQGGTFLLAWPPKDVKHLYIVLSDVEKYPEQIVIVNFTSCRSYGEETCVFVPEQHPYIKRQTTIYYMDAKIITKTILQDYSQHPTFSHNQPVSEDVFNLILKGAAESRFLKLKIKQALEKQGLI